MAFTPNNKAELKSAIMNYNRRRRNDMSMWNISRVSDFNELFSGYIFNNQTDIISDWDVSHVTDMAGMFENCVSFNQPLNWDVSHVEYMYEMFYNCSAFNQPLNFNGGPWNVSSVTDIRGMFGDCVLFNQPLNWDVSHVTDMDDVFCNCSAFNQPLNWDVSNVRNMLGMFHGCSAFNQSLNEWDVSNVRNMFAMFRNCALFNQPLDEWDVSKVEYMNKYMNVMYGMFENCHAFNQPLNEWDVSKVENMNGMFRNCALFNQPLDEWDVSKVEDMNGMFENCRAFNQPLNEWNVSNVRNMNGMFRNCALFNQPLDAWDVSKVEDMIGMFENCITFNQPLRSWRLPRLNPFNNPRIVTIEDANKIFNGAVSMNENNKPLFNQNWNLLPRRRRATPRARARARATPRQPRATAQPRTNPYAVHQFFNLSLVNHASLIPLLTKRTPPGNISIFFDSTGSKFSENAHDLFYSFYNQSYTRPTPPKKDPLQEIFQQASGLDLTIPVLNVDGVTFQITLRDFFVASLLFGQRRTQEYKDVYVNFFQDECINAYPEMLEGVNRISCPKGILERFITNIPKALKRNYPDSLDAEVNEIDSKADLIKICEYIIGPDESGLTQDNIQNVYASNCYTLISNNQNLKTIEEKKQAFKECVLVAYETNGGNRNASTIDVVDRFINNPLNSSIFVMDGGRRNKKLKNLKRTKKLNKLKRTKRTKKLKRTKRTKKLKRTKTNKINSETKNTIKSRRLI